MVKGLVLGGGSPGVYDVIISQGTNKQPNTGQGWISTDKVSRSKDGLIQLGALELKSAASSGRQTHRHMAPAGPGCQMSPILHAGCPSPSASPEAVTTVPSVPSVLLQHSKRRPWHYVFTWHLFSNGITFMCIYIPKKSLKLL